MASPPIPEHYGLSRRVIVKAFIAVRQEEAVTGSKMIRRIAERVGAKIDKNGSHSHIRLVVNDYVAFLRQASPDPVNVP